MNLKMNSTLLLNNMTTFNDMVNKVYNMDLPLTKECGEDVTLKKDELTCLKVSNAVYHKYLVDFYYDKHKNMHANAMNQKAIDKVKKYKMDIYLTNMYLHFDSKRIEKIKLIDIDEIEIFNNYVIIYSRKRIKSVIYTYSLEIIITLVTLIEVLTKIKLNDNFANKSIKINVNKEENV